MEQKSIEYKMGVVDDERKYHWNSCCLKVDKRALSFFTQVTFSALTVAFCIVMLITSQDCVTFSRWSPLLTLVIGVWLPSPQLKES